jgi:hypothetical protein
MMTKADKRALEPVLLAGACLSNAAFNLAQDMSLPEHKRRSLKLGQMEWDQAVTNWTQYGKKRRRGSSR